MAAAVLYVLIVIAVIVSPFVDPPNWLPWTIPVLFALIGLTRTIRQRKQNHG